MLDKMERFQTPEKSSKAIHFRFPQPVRTGRIVLELEKINKSYDTLKIYQNFSVT
ncbi:MAG: hypothetical protein CM1200mP16_00590 [Nitrospina sp.]|nr:MAG: hypothetical protein CM1200mP16_00590 [Nitrospina sp.]